MNMINLALKSPNEKVLLPASNDRLIVKKELNNVLDKFILKIKQFIQIGVLSVLCNISYSQNICFDGIYCPFPGDATFPADPTDNGCGTGGTDEYGNVDFVLDPGTDVGAGGTCDILQIFIDYEPDGNVYLSFIQANQGQACYSFYFDTDCDATTGSNEDLLDPADGIELTAQGAEIRFLICVQGDNVNDPEVETWDGSGWVANGANTIQGLAGFTDGCSGTNEAFVETQIPIDDLLNVCDPTTNCGTLNLTTFLTFAGGSFNSQECDVTFESAQTTVPAQVMADLAAPGPSCTENVVTLDASGSSGSLSLVYEWDFDGDGIIDQTTTTPTVTTTYTTPGTYTVTVGVSDSNPQCPDAMPDMATVMITICGASAVTCPPSPVDVLEGDPIDPTILGEPIVTTSDCNPTFELSFVDTPGPGDCLLGLEEIITRVFTITDACGVSECIQIINVEDINPPMVAADLAQADPVCFGEDIVFDASGSTGFTDLVYDWDFDGDGIIDQTTTTPIVTNSYPNPGIYTVSVTVTAPTSPCPLDPETTSIEITICDQIAVICPIATVSIVDGDPMDPTALGEPTFTTNECNPNPQVSFIDSAAPATCPLEEIITRTFTITDNCGDQQCIQIIEVEVDNPASINSLPITPEICLGDVVTLDASASIGDGLTYCWNVGAGQLGCDYTTAIATHQYAAAGTYEITLMITDQFGCTDEQVVGSVIVYEGPEAIGTAVFDPCTLELVYDASGSIDNAPPSDLIFTWDFGDGSTSGTSSGTYTFGNCASVGTITLTILDPTVPFPACNSDQLTFNFTTDSEPPVVVCPGSLDINCGDPIPSYADLTEFIAAGGSALDNCGVLALNQVSLDTIPGLCPYVHSITVSYEVLDICNNGALCTQTINLLPKLPNATVPEDIIISCGDDFTTAGTGLPLLDQSDCTRPSTLSIDDEITSGSCPGDATIERTFTVLDDCGNEQVYVQIITIVNDVEPTLEGPPDITIGCLDACDPDATGGIATVVDFCMPIDGSINTVTVTYTDEYVGWDGSAAVGGIVGYIIRTTRAEDACGNVGIYVQTISVMRDALTVLTCNDQVNVSLAQDCQGITPDYLLEAPADTKYFIHLEDGQFGFTLDPNETFDSIDWSVYIESGEPFNYTITDFCGNSCWGQVLIESNSIPEFETPCTFVSGDVLDKSGEINDQDALQLNDVISTNEDPGRTTDYLGPINLTDESCQEAFVVGFSNFRYTEALHNAPPDIQYVNLELYLVNTEDGSVLSFALPTGTIGLTSLPELQLNPGHYDVFVSAADYRAFGDYSIHIDVSACLPTCTTICGGDYPEEFVTVEEINETLTGGCFATLIGDVEVEETESGDMCDGILHVVTFTGLFQLHGELVKHEFISQAYVEQPIDLNQYDIQAPRRVDLDCGADVSPEAILAQTGSGSQAYPFYFDFEHRIEDTICLEEVIIHYEVPIDTIQEVVDVDGIWVLLDVVKKELRDSIQCLRKGLNPVTQYQQIFLNDNLCNVLVDYSDIVIDVCAGGKKVIRDWVIIDWCDSNAKIKLSQLIEAKDTEAPTIQKWDDVVISVDPWSCAGKYKLPVGDYTDNCNSDLLTTSWQLSEGHVVDGYAIDLWLANNPIEAHLLVTDDCGNTARDTFNIIVEDQIAPVPVCMTDLNVTLTSAMLAVNDGSGIVYADAFDGGSHDSGCSEIDIKVRRVNGCCSAQCIDQYECTASDPKTGICIDSTIVGFTTEYAEFVKFCCEDIGQVTMVEVLVTDQVGNFNSCIVEVTVIDKTQSILSCPPITVNCLDDMDSIENPSISGQFCDTENGGAILLNVSETNGYCGTEQLIREWYIDGNEDGEFSSGDPYCRQMVSITSNDGGLDPYTIKWPKHYTGEIVQGQNLECESDGTLGLISEAAIEMGEVQVCGVNSESYGEPIWCEAACSLIAHSMEVDTVFSSDACFKLINRWTIIDWCQWNSNGGEVDDDNDSSRDQFVATEDWAQGECAACPKEGPVFDDPVYFKYVTVEKDGYYTFDQIIKVVDDTAPTIAVIQTHEVSTSGGAISKEDATSCRGDEELTATVTDFCNGVESPAVFVNWNVTIQRGEYIIDIQNGVGSSMTINTGAGSPGDKHVITWKATDGCGNEAVAITEVTFGDDVQPTPFCIAAVSTNFPAGQDSVVVWASDVDFGSYDNCTDHSDLQWAIVPEGQFPLEPGAVGFDDQFGYSIACENESTVVFIDLWIWDKSGNSDFCRSSILVNNGCAEETESSAFIIAGQLHTELGIEIGEAKVSLNSAIPEYPKFQDVTSQGKYSFDNNPLGFNYGISPKKDLDHANGVTTLDLLLIQRHILGLRDLGSPYKIIAADVTNDQAISVLDIVEARRLVLGTIDRFSNNQSWRFVDEGQEFLASDNPWPFIEMRELANIDNHFYSENFIGIKIGDVNDNATPSESVQAETRYVSTLQLDAKISPSNPKVLQISSQNKVELFGFQFTLSEMNNEVVNIQSEDIDIEEENYFLNGTTHFSWHSKDGQAINDQFELEIEFADELTLAQLEQLSIVLGTTKAEAYLTPAFDIWDISLSLDLSQDVQPTLSQNWPNPFRKSTLIEFELPKSSKSLTLSIHNSAGQLVWKETQPYVAGTYQIEINSEILGASDVYHYTIKTEYYSETKQMILMD